MEVAGRLGLLGKVVADQWRVSGKVLLWGEWKKSLSSIIDKVMPSVRESWSYVINKVVAVTDPQRTPVSMWSLGHIQKCHSELCYNPLLYHLYWVKSCICETHDFTLLISYSLRLLPLCRNFHTRWKKELSLRFCSGSKGCSLAYSHAALLSLFLSFFFICRLHFFSQIWLPPMVSKIWYFYADILALLCENPMGITARCLL